MTDVEIPFPLSSSPGLRPQDGSGRLINAYAEPRGENLGPVFRRVPGLANFANAVNTAGGFRGAIQVAGTLYVAFEDTAYSINSSGVATSLGTLTGTERVFWARNNAATPDIALVTDGLAYQVSAGSIITYPDGDVGAPSTLWSHLGYFMFGYGDGDMQSSDLNSTNLNTLNTARTESNPDGVSRGWSYNGQMYVAGEHSIEVWGGVNTTGFPVSRQGFNIIPGLISADAVAGFEPEFGNPPLYVASDSTVRFLSEYDPQKVSPPWLDRLIEDVADKDTLSASVYISAGHSFWQLSCDDWSAVFDLNSQKWHERNSYLRTRSRIVRSFPAFDKWLCGDTASGDIKEISSAAAGEAQGGFLSAVNSGIANESLDLSGSGGGTTWRQRIEASVFENVSSGNIRLTFAASRTHESLYIAEAFIDYAGDSECSFATSTPTPITFGNDTIIDVLIPVGTTVTSDEIAFDLSAGLPVIVSFYIIDGSADDGLSSSSDGWTLFEKAADEAETQTATGYTEVVSGVLVLQQIEVLADSSSDDDPLIVRIESGPVEAFPNRTRVPRADFKFATGVGIATGSDPDQTNPTTLISWSDDGGVTWSNPYERNLGRQARANARVAVNNTGMAGPMGRRWRLDVSDAVDVAFMGGTMTNPLVRTK